MKTLLYSLFSYLLFFNITITSAQGWEKTYVDSMGLSRAFDVVATDDGYILAGELDLPTGAIRHYIQVVKTDLNGNLQWEKNFHEPWDIADESAAFIDQTSDGNYILGGSQSRQPFLIKLNSAGDTIWTKKKTFSDGSALIYAGALLSDYGFLLVGTKIISTGGPTPAIPYLIKFDSLGNFLWESTITEPFYSQIIYDVKETSDNGFILVGRDENEQSILIKTDSTGNLQWRKHYELTANNFGGCVVETPDGGFIIGGTTTGIPGQVPFFLKVDAVGAFDWLKFHSNLPLGGVSYIQQTSDNGFIATGSSLAFWQSTGVMGFVIKFDEDGEQEWIEEFNNNVQGSAIYEISDGGFIICGFKNGGMLLKKIGGTTNTQQTFSLQIELSVFPNPMNEFTTFKIETNEFQTFLLRVFNATGQLVKTEQFNTSIFNFYKKNLSAGIYFYEISSEEKLLANGKLEIH